MSSNVDLCHFYWLHDYSDWNSWCDLCTKFFLVFWPKFLDMSPSTSSLAGECSKPADSRQSNRSYYPSPELQTLFDSLSGQSPTHIFCHLAQCLHAYRCRDCREGTSRPECIEGSQLTSHGLSTWTHQEGHSGVSRSKAPYPWNLSCPQNKVQILCDAETLLACEWNNYFLWCVSEDIIDSYSCPWLVITFIFYFFLISSDITESVPLQDPLTLSSTLVKSRQFWKEKHPRKGYWRHVANKPLPGLEETNGGLIWHQHCRPPPC